MFFNRDEKGVEVPVSDELKDIATGEFTVSFWFFLDTAFDKSEGRDIVFLSAFNQFTVINKNTGVSHPELVL